MTNEKIKGGLWKSRIKRSDITILAIKGLSNRALKNFLSIGSPHRLITVLTYFKYYSYLE